MRGLPGQPRLPDPGLPYDEHHAAMSRSRRRQGSIQMTDLLVPPNQHRAQHLPHTTSIGTALAFTVCCVCGFVDGQMQADAIQVCGRPERWPVFIRSDLKRSVCRVRAGLR